MSSLIEVVQALQAKAERENTNENAGYSTGTWTPSFTGFSANPTGVMARYVLIGKLVTCFVYMGGAGTSNTAGFTVSAPFTAATVAGGAWMNAIAYCVDNSAGAAAGYAQIASAGTVFTLTKSAGAGWTAALTKLAHFTITYEIA